MEAASPVNYRTGPVAVLPLWDALGFTCFIIWGASLYWYPFQSSDENEILTISLVRLALVIGAILAAVAIFLLRRRTRLLLDDYVGPVIAGILCSSISVAFLVNPHMLGLLLPMALIAGVGQVVFTMYWRKRFASFSKAQVSLVMAVVGIGLLVGIGAFTIIKDLILPVGLTILMGVALGSYLMAQRFDPAICAVAVGTARAESVNEPKNRQKALRRNLTLGAFQIPFGFGAVWVACGPLVQWGIPILAAAVIIAVLIVVICQFVVHADLDELLFAWTLPVEGACTLAFCSLGVCIGSAVALAVLFSVMFAGLYAIETGNNEASLTTKQVRLIELGSMERMCIVSGYGIGWACAIAASWISSDAPFAVLACAFLLYLIATVFEHMVLRAGDTAQDNHFTAPLEYLEHIEPDSEATRLERRCRFLSKKYGLTPRQTDVFMMLCRGRNNSYIQEELTLSRNTVKSHISAVYGKFEVGSQQELITFVESYAVEEPAKDED